MSKVGKAAALATQNVRAVHTAALGAPPAWAGYWTFVTATIILAFILYVTKKGHLSTWIGFFSWTSPAPVGNTGGSAPSNTTQGVVGQILNGPTGNASIPATTPGQANAIPWSSVGSSVWSAAGSFLNSGASVVPKSAGGTAN
jgi:hypothetical protein